MDYCKVSRSKEKNRLTKIDMDQKDRNVPINFRWTQSEALQF